MCVRDARHTTPPPPPLSVVLVLEERCDNHNGETGGGWGVTPDRPAKAAKAAKGQPKSGARRTGSVVSACLIP